MKLTLSIILTLLVNSSYAQTFEWAQKFGTNGIPESVHSLITDNEGNFYIAGVVSGTFNNATSNNHMAYFGDTVLAINGADDIFIAKYSPIGNLIWAKTFGGDYDWNPLNSNSIIKNETVHQLIFDSKSNSLYLTGLVIGSCYIDGICIDSIPGHETNFVCKINLDGTCSWAKSIENVSAYYGLNIVSTGNTLLLSGYLASTTTLYNHQLAKGSFIAELNENGVCSTVKTVSNLPITSINYQEKKIYATLEFTQTDTINVDMISESVNPNFSGSLLALFDSSLSIKWYKKFSSNSWYSGIGKLKVDEHGNASFIIGFLNDLYFENDTIEYSINRYNCLMSYDSLGHLNYSNLKFSKHISDYAFSSNSVYSVGGVFSSDTICDTAISNSQNWSAYLSTGFANFECNDIGIWNNGCIYNLVVNPDSSIVVAGIIGPPGSDCGNCTSTLNLGNISLTSAGSTDGFIAKFNGFTSGIDDRSRKSKSTNESLLIYANPSNGKCDIEIPDDFLNEKELKLSIYSSTGLLIQQATVNMNEETIKVDIQQEAKGMYNATLSNGKKVYQGRIVFE
jgi:hypothetical protein